MLKFAIDLTWVRHKIVGGTESFVHNLLKGFGDSTKQFEMVMVTAEDNTKYFKKYLQDARISLLVAPVQASSVFNRIIWQNLKLSKFLKINGINLCLEPVYCRPILAKKCVKFVTVIHDLEALHFPQNHNWVTNIWLRIAWHSAIKSSNYIIAISEFVREDIINTYHISKEKITTIYDPIVLDVNEKCDFQTLKEKYGIDEKQYYYTVSKLNKHKNLSTLVRVFGEIKKRNIKTLPCKLVISGVNGGMEDELWRIAKDYNIEEEIVLTGFVENQERNTLYANARTFLFPSIFEGFGMPPIEAIALGVPVVTTREACIPEVTQNIANYVCNPYDVEEWINVMENVENKCNKFHQELYCPMVIANQYLEVLNEQ